MTHLAIIFFVHTMEPEQCELKTHVLDTSNLEYELTNIIEPLVNIIKEKNHEELTAVIKYTWKRRNSVDQKFSIPEDEGTYNISEFDADWLVSHLTSKINKVFSNKYSQLQIVIGDKKWKGDDVFDRVCIRILAPDTMQPKWLFQKIINHFEINKIKVALLYR